LEEEKPGTRIEETYYCTYL